MRIASRIGVGLVIVLVLELLPLLVKSVPLGGKKTRTKATPVGFC
jgi:hypothetical protein